MDQSLLPRTIDAIGELRVLDRFDPLFARAARSITRDDAASRLLSGAVIGHRLHPVLTDAPLGVWTSAGILDVVGGPRAKPAAQRLTGLGLLLALPTALAGLADWNGAEQRDRRMGIVHAVGNTAGIMCEWKSWQARRKGHHGRGVLWSTAGLGLLAGAGAIGGHLSFARGVGVDHEVPMATDGNWHGVAHADELFLDQPRAATAGDASIAVVRRAGGVCAMAGVCSHAGGPLADGKVVGDGLECPWHGSRFALRDGRVERGPAVTAQPVYETRVAAGEVSVRAGA